MKLRHLPPNTWSCLSEILILFLGIIYCLPQGFKKEIINIKKNRVQIKLNEAYLNGRARINCTTKVDDKWYWFGYQFLVK